LPDNFGTPEKRRLLRQHQQEWDEWVQDKEKFDQNVLALLTAGISPGCLQYQVETPSYPEELRGLLCGAKTKRGTLCKQRSLFTNGRCKFHGGASTGPRTKKGKKRSARNGFQPKAKRTS